MDSDTVSIGQLTGALQKSVKEAIVASYPILPDFNINSTYSDFRSLLDKEQKNLSNLMSQLMVKARMDDRRFRKGDTPDDKYDSLCAINDVITDRINHSLDDAEGLKKKNQELIIATLSVKGQSSISSSQDVDWQSRGVKRSFDEINLLSAKNISRPQIKFKDKINNKEGPFIPFIREKPHSVRPLAIFLEAEEDGIEHFCHPYEAEINFYKPLDEAMIINNIQEPTDIEKCSYKLISTKEELNHLCESLKQVREIAVDLEHHSYRSFQGFTCLMQISTRSNDYIIDALELRSELHILNELLTNPKIVKVLHGADSDILWLQKDFGIYVVNMFDTGQAARLLGLSHQSLQFLLNHYCGKTVNKKFQLADWRIRPLPNEMLKYAQEDTHYLLYIYDRMRKDLIEKDSSKQLIQAVFEFSKKICLKRYEKPAFTPDGYNSIIKKSRANFNSQQLYALEQMYAWRDRIARREDESYGYILPNHMMLQIAEILPREQQGILALCNPVPPMVKQQLNELHKMILKARSMPIVNTSTSIAGSRSLINHSGYDYDNHLNLRHDQMDIGDSEHLFTLLKDGKGDDIDYEKIAKKYEKFTDSASTLFDFFAPPKKKNAKRTCQSVSSYLTSLQKLLPTMSRPS